MSKQTNEVDIHPAMAACLIDPANPKGGASFTREMLDAAFTPAQQRLTGRMLLGLREVYGIDWSPMISKRGAETLSHVALIYPSDVWSLFLLAPKGDVIERLSARGIDVRVQEIDSGDFLIVMWPVAELIKLAEVWADLDAAGLTCCARVRNGMIAGTIQRF